MRTDTITLHSSCALLVYKFWNDLNTVETLEKHSP